jgi:hypothetical protein
VIPVRDRYFSLAITPLITFHDVRRVGLTLALCVLIDFEVGQKEDGRMAEAVGTNPVAGQDPGSMIGDIQAETAANRAFNQALRQASREQSNENSYTGVVTNNDSKKNQNADKIGR